MLDLKKLHNDIDAVYCCCEDCRKRARRTKPENLPLLGTVMNTEYAMYNYNYDVSHENYDQFLSSLRDILVKHPKLTIPVLAALSELFLPKEHMAVYHFPTASVPAKKLINLIVSLFYDRVYEYTPELMEYRIPDCIFGRRWSVLRQDHRYSFHDFLRRCNRNRTDRRFPQSCRGLPCTLQK